MYIAKRMVVAAAVLLAGLASPASWANLVVNGDFEADAIGNGGLGAGPPPGFGFDYRASLTGWTVAAPPNGVVLFNNLYRAVGGGSQSLQLENPDNYIEQSITTVSGQKYALTFDLASYVPPGVSTLEVEIGSDPTLFFAGTSDYVTYSVVFTATSTSTLIHFENGDAVGAPSTYPHIDDISVTAIPEPGSLALVSLALAGFGIARRRKHA